MTCHAQVPLELYSHQWPHMAKFVEVGQFKFKHSANHIAELKKLLLLCLLKIFGVYMHVHSYVCVYVYVCEINDYMKLMGNKICRDNTC